MSQIEKLLDAVDELWAATLSNEGSDWQHVTKVIKTSSAAREEYEADQDHIKSLRDLIEITMKINFARTKQIAALKQRVEVLEAVLNDLAGVGPMTINIHGLEETLWKYVEAAKELVPADSKPLDFLTLDVTATDKASVGCPQCKKPHLDCSCPIDTISGAEAVKPDSEGIKVERCACGDAHSFQQQGDGSYKCEYCPKVIHLTRPDSEE